VLFLLAPRGDEMKEETLLEILSRTINEELEKKGYVHYSAAVGSLDLIGYGQLSLAITLKTCSGLCFYNNSYVIGISHDLQQLLRRLEVLMKDALMRDLIEAIQYKEKYE